MTSTRKDPDMTTTPTAAELRAEASQREQDARDSFERCDTDGALSQWASGIGAQRLRLQADIVDQGGVARFLTLFTLDGRFQPAKAIQTRYGMRWMILDENGNRTGDFAPYLPKRRDTLAKRGYLEGYAYFPAKADYREGRGGLVTVSVVTVKTVPEHEHPVEIETVDRWETKETDFQTCVECGRRFDLNDKGDIDEWMYGHDCEVA